MMSYEDTNKKESKDDGLRFPALERSLLDEALSLLVSARTGALALSVNATKAQRSLTPTGHDFHLPAIIGLQRRLK